MFPVHLTQPQPARSLDRQPSLRRAGNHGGQPEPTMPSRAGALTQQ